MASDPEDAERQRKLRELDAKLKARQVAERRPSTLEGHPAQAQLAWRMVIELVAGLGIGFGIGYGLDSLFGTMPVFLVLFIMLGLAAGVKTMLRSAREIETARAAAAAQDEGRSDGDRE